MGSASKGVGDAIVADQRSCGVWVIDLRTGQTAAYVKFMDAVQEIFSVQVLSTSRWPDLINDDPEILTQSFVLPDEALGELDPDIRDRETASSKKVERS